ncbi:YiiX/YebB-like N1pC/P60 family cysteine hydrolase [Palaeococcus ferrophilus]|uniref:YiiX/YebB-like N1pC/P60 family cysteine hydrolase n=1 Tax=Palaeococcus ferrophilus TaxID=83868 RepID=UPI000697A4BA|nr:YiiX/YebB-like N1pC/P60 family cysteine hydrolase [Palaeococcus ferrophilus]
MKRYLPFVLLLFLAFQPSAFAFSGGGGGYEHPYPEDVMVGDILVGHSPDSDWLIPGYWTHTSLVAYEEDGEWYVVEAWFSGVRVISLREYIGRYDDIAILRVSASGEVKANAVQFALAQLGKPYDFALWTKQVYGSSYYCSELVWAAYIAAGGPDVDAHPRFSWRYLWGVAPQEIYDDGDTVQIYRHSS